ncbi:YlbF family regulator [Mycoplasmatota bacterium]|nr:YlbF family regulator [Mycoplasmatota bacterium]
MSAKEELLQLIKDNESVKRYQQIETVINKDKTLKKNINKLKSIQKQLINAKEINKTEAINKFQSEFDQLLEEIESFPLMSEYLDLQEEINHMVKEVLQIIENQINEGIDGV